MSYEPHREAHVKWSPRTVGPHKAFQGDNETCQAAASQKKHYSMMLTGNSLKNKDLR